MKKKYYNTKKAHIKTTTGKIANLHELIVFINKEAGTKIRHRDIMLNLMPKVVQSRLWDVIEEMGGDRAATIQIKVSNTLGGANTVTTYPLIIPTQVRFMMAKLSPRYLCFLVDRLHSLEQQHGLPTTQDLLRTAIYTHTRYHIQRLKPEGVSTIERIVSRRGHRDCRFYFKPNHYINTILKHPNWDKVQVRRDNSDGSTTRLI